MSRSTRPDDRRGFYTSWIQTTATLGLFLSLIVILIVQGSLSKEAFADWGWRVPFMRFVPAARRLDVDPHVAVGIARHSRR
jgi:MFS family permease